jgi:SAM-dependent methyltransferase
MLRLAHRGCSRLRCHAKIFTLRSLPLPLRALPRRTLWQRDTFEESLLMKQWGFTTEELDELGIETPPPPKDPPPPENLQERSVCQITCLIIPRLTQLQQSIREKGDQPDFKVQEALNLLEKLSTFPAGRNLISTGSWSTNDIADFCLKNSGPYSSLSDNSFPDHCLEDLSDPHGIQSQLHKIPSVEGIRERWTYVKSHLASVAEEHIEFGCLPGGLVDFHAFNSSKSILNFHIHTFTTSEDDIYREKHLAVNFELFDFVNFAGKFQQRFNKNVFDLITTNGIDLFHKKFDSQVLNTLSESLKPGGCLVLTTSTPLVQHQTSKFDKELIKMDKIIHHVFGWSGYSEKEIIGFLQDAGWVKIEAFPGETGSVLVVLARKPEDHTKPKPQEYKVHFHDENDKAVVEDELFKTEAIELPPDHPELNPDGPLKKK